MVTKKRTIGLSVLHGEPLDGSGRHVIHLFVQDPKGPFVEPHVLHQAIGEDGVPIKQQLEARSTRGRLACDAKRDVRPVTRDGVTHVTMRTDDPRGVTCRKCIGSDYYREAMDKIASITQG